MLLTFSRGVVVELYRASALLGIGTGLSMAALATLIVANVSQAETGAAAGVNNVARTLRGAIGGRTARHGGSTRLSLLIQPFMRCTSIASSIASRRLSSISSL
ncbi:MAG: hypothetical protein WB557_24140 [Solirubrobacteraceae bacterium]